MSKYHVRSGQKGRFMDYIRLAATTDFIAECMKSFSVMGRKIAVIRREDGSFYAIEASCKHQGADLTTGEIRNNVATCPRHQWMYDLESGECLNHDSLPLRKYDLRLDGENILVSLLPLDE